MTSLSLHFNKMEINLGSLSALPKGIKSDSHKMLCHIHTVLKGTQDCYLCYSYPKAGSQCPEKCPPPQQTTPPLTPGHLQLQPYVFTQKGRRLYGWSRGRNSCSVSALRIEAQVQRAVGERSATTLGLLHDILGTIVFLQAISKGGSTH